MNPLVQGRRPDSQLRRRVPPPHLIEEGVQGRQLLHLGLEGVHGPGLLYLGRVLGFRGQPVRHGEGLLQPIRREGVAVRHVPPVLPAQGPNVHDPQGSGLVRQPGYQVQGILAPGVVRVREDDNIPPGQGRQVRVLGTPGTVQGGYPDPREEPSRRSPRLLPLREQDQGLRVLGQPVRPIEGPGLAGFLGLPLARGPPGPTNYRLAAVFGVIAPDNQEEPSVRVPIAPLLHGVTVAVRDRGVPRFLGNREDSLGLLRLRRWVGRGHLRPSQGRQLGQGMIPGFLGSNVQEIGQEGNRIRALGIFQGKVRPCAAVQIQAETSRGPVIPPGVAGHQLHPQDFRLREQGEENSLPIC